MTADPKTIATYDAQAAEYAANFGNKKLSAELRAFMDHLPAGGDVLDFGCGPGTDAHFLAQEGFSVSAMDASAQMVATAKSKGIDARQASFSELNDKNAFDGIWANFSLLHAPRDAFPDHLAAVHRALRSNGVFHIGMKTGDGAERDVIDRMYTFYSEQALKSHLDNAGFEVLSTTTGKGKGLAGTIDPWVIILSRRRG